MMAAYCDPTAAAAAAASPSGLAGASRAGPGASDGRAPLRWPFTSRAQQERAQRRAAACEESGSELGSDEESQDEPGHAVSTRGRDESGISDSEESSKEVSSAVVNSQEARENPPPVVAPVTVTAEMMAARYSAMFVIGAAEVQVSGQPPVGRKATKSLVKLATDHMNKVSDADIKALSSSFGNFDRRVGLGWLLGDAVRPVGSPLMERAVACAVGVKAQRVAAKIKTDVRDGKLAIQRELCKLATDDPRREALQVQLEGVEAEVLRADVDLALPPVTPAPAAAAKPTGSRKRAREAEPSHEEMMEEFQEGLLVCKKWVKEAEADVASAAEKHKKKAAVVARVAKKFEGKLKPKQIMHFLQVLEGARDALNVAVIEEKEAEIYLLNAKLHASETRADMYFAEWEHAHNEGIESSERAAKVLKLARTLSESVAQHAKNL